ncbi:hypothetical protein CR513_40936, partial [Mucuna pruriens]
MPPWATFGKIPTLLLQGALLLFDFSGKVVEGARVKNFEKEKKPKRLGGYSKNLFRRKATTLNYYYEKNRKSLRCCTPLLYLRMTAHLFHSKQRMACPIEDSHWSWVKVMSKSEWTQCLEEASEKTICWYPKWNEQENVIIKCGGFPNVPLMGTQGGINYNPELVPRQAGYPMILPPHDWKSIIKRGHKWGTRSCRASSSYKAWLKSQVKQIRLSSNNPQLDAGKAPASKIRQALKVEELEVTLMQIELEHKVLKRKVEVALVAQVAV